MDNREERTRRVLHGLEVCGLGPEWMEDCEKHGCPYLDVEDENCVSRLCRDARALILELDNLVNHMEEPSADAGTSSDPASGATFPNPSTTFGGPPPPKGMAAHTLSGEAKEVPAHDGH